MNRCSAYESQLQEFKSDKAKQPEIPLQSAIQRLTENLEASLTEMYARLLSFLASGLRVFSMNPVRRALHALWNPQEIIEFEEEYTKIEQNVKTESELLNNYCKKEVKDNVILILNTTTLMSTTIFKTKVVMEDIKSMLEEHRRLDVLRWVSKMPTDDHHTIARDKRTPQTGQWILQKQEFQRWIESSSPLLLWIHGIRKNFKTSLTPY